jgi:hypothetical protein
VTTNDNTSDTLATWCVKRRVSRSSLYRLRSQGKGPRLHYVGVSPRISPEADRDWVREREAEAASKDVGGQ